jgi:septal ring factor EnvC (AmiA/AmiB activator)
MLKVLFILSILVTGVALVFAYRNGRSFADVRNNVAQINTEIAREKQADAALLVDCARLSGDVAKVKGELDVEQERLKQNKNRFTLADSDSKRVQEEFDAKLKKKAELEKELTGLPSGMKPETIVQDINKMKQEQAELEAQALAKADEVKKEEAKIAEAQKKLDDVTRKIEERRKLFERNSLQARVLAVNPDWGFVVIDAGKASGIEQDTKLLVTRNRQTVGKISILSVEGGRSVASIVPDAIYGGSSISPGDRVVLENLTAGK